MGVKMPWLQERLRELDRTPAGLARHLGLAGPRVYEMIGGKRSIQPNEMKPMADYLDWTVQELMAKLPKAARVVPHQKQLSPVGADELKCAILDMIATRFTDRQLDIFEVVTGLQLCIFHFKQLYVFTPKKDEKPKLPQEDEKPKLPLLKA